MNSGRTKAEALRVNKLALRRVNDSKLPPVRSFFEDELGCQLSRPDRRGEAGGNCCFHQSKKRKSFKVNVETGLWFCHGCGFGGDMYSFVERRYGLSYLDAAKYLGTLEDGAPIEVPTRLVPYLIFEYDVDGVHYRAEVNDEPKSALQLDRRLHAAAADRLAEIRKGDAEVFEGEAETQWGILALSWNLIQMELGYDR
jgi:CHC2 zinc finger